MAASVSGVTMCTINIQWRKNPLRQALTILGRQNKIGSHNLLHRFYREWGVICQCGLRTYDSEAVEGGATT